LVLADKYRYYLEEVKRIKLAEGIQVKKIVYFTGANTDKTPEGQVIDRLGLTNVCCRRHFLTHVDIE
jgi:DNA-directed RNA polymerase I, II, and III subunit RPABC5